MHAHPAAFDSTSTLAGKRTLAQDRHLNPKARGLGGGAKKRRGNGEGTDKSSKCDIDVTCVDVRCFAYKLFWNCIGFARFVSQEV